MVAASCFLATWGILHYGFYTHRLLLDTPLYERYGDAIVHDGKLPYRDFGVEYPPGALPVFALPSLFAGAGDFGTYARVFEALMGLCGIGCAVAVAGVAGRLQMGRLRLATIIGLAALGPLALGPVVLSRFDLWPTALTAVALAALLSGRVRSAFALLAIGFAAKLFPIVLLPLAITYVWRRAGRRESLVCTSWFASVSALVLAPFLILAPHGLWASIVGQASRPLQIESVGASFLLAAHDAAGVAITMEPSHGSDNLVGALPHALASVQTALQVSALAAAWILFARGPATNDRLLRTAAAAVCAFVALGKVLSPQFLVWLIPLVPLVRGRRGAYAGLLLVSAMVLTQLWFPYRYLDLSFRFDAVASWLVLARDLVLVTLLVVLLLPDRAVSASGRPAPG